MAGLPKSAGIIALLAVASLAVSLVSVAQDLAPLPIEIELPSDVETASSPLQPVIDLIEANGETTEDERSILIAAFEAAVDAEVLTPEEALEMLALVTWESRTLDDNLALVIDALETTLAGLVDGEIAGDPLSALAETLGDALSPPGMLTALGKAGTAAENLMEAADLVADGVPPGILVRIIKDALRDGRSTDEISQLLSDLKIAIEENQGWGQAANDVTDQGEFKHRDEEKNENQGKNDEPEEEANQHGSQGNNGKALGKDK
jgi:hypothetical protein